MTQRGGVQRSTRTTISFRGGGETATKDVETPAVDEQKATLELLEAAAYELGEIYTRLGVGLSQVVLSVQKRHPNSTNEPAGASLLPSDWIDGDQSS